MYWKTQLFPYLRGQDLIGFIDGSTPCPPSTITVDGHQVVNPAHLDWTRQDQLIMSLLIASLFEDVIPLVVGLDTSQQVYTTLETSLASASNTRIMQLHMNLQNLKQDGKPISTYLQQAKSYADALTAASRPLSLADLNLYILKGFRPEAIDLLFIVHANTT